ncbi:hypothetical protein HK098_001134 [Nowakowskiella sp. JEL0407]|nr:hypothetical protein HK098_001134 [Nowakowskiella sp. JEL0407]
MPGRPLFPIRERNGLWRFRTLTALEMYERYLSESSVVRSNVLVPNDKLVALPSEMLSGICGCFPMDRDTSIELSMMLDSFKNLRSENIGANDAATGSFAANLQNHPGLSINPNNASTFQTSYKAHDVNDLRITERAEYRKNKGKATKCADWWGQPGETLPLKKEDASCYRESFKQHSFEEIRQNFNVLPIAGKSNPSNNGASAFPNSNIVNSSPSDRHPLGFQESWVQFRMKKPVSEDGGKHYDILTGQQLGRAPSGVYDPTKRANRVSIDKLNAKQAGADRNYDIISNKETIPRFALGFSPVKLKTESRTSAIPALIDKSPLPAISQES